MVQNPNTMITARSVLVTFDRPTVITGVFSYELMYMLDGTMQTLTSLDTTFNIAGLTPATMYTFMVREILNCSVLKNLSFLYRC